MGLTGKAEQRGPCRQVRGSARDELPLPIAPLVASLWGPPESRECTLQGKGRPGHACHLSGGRYLSTAGRNPRGDSRGGFQ